MISRGSKEDSSYNTLKKGDPMGGFFHIVISYVVAPNDTITTQYRGFLVSPRK